MSLDEPRARDRYPYWHQIANDTIAILRAEAGCYPEDPACVELIRQPSTRSTAFRTRRAANNLRAHRGGVKTFRHPLVGEIALPFENLQADSVSGQVLTDFTAQPGSAEADALRLLASWNADSDHGTSHQT